ncbi:hypothetical protein OV203_10690 [Nannocystis sp. ILAH1]|uniref:hypothetical protein n=1 Tax=Nannocystis sp. ILAH1 TaxID=2996789 RepID=UPI0022720662|nr:hypothetical protein [Nannocystis sp. ILAH1]MCY0987593.1 hypothetical protein [Nannocystis sp. ILAH1]
MSLVEALSQLFPISSEHHSLELVDESVDADSGEVYGGRSATPEGGLVATVRLVVWDVQGEERMMRDIKEQRVTIVAAEHLEDPRVPAYLEGLAAALNLAFARVDETIADKGHGALSDRLAEAMPYEFFPGDVLALRRPQTAEDFSDALLTNRKRLGWLLP